ncbi:DUF3224 domain-containing protein [Pseudoalteromonas piscicida]|uniref:DUF3224 family protein n=1 Tax=Pseudoalteromonas piscicida TaxID=43662 RepID=A0AAD0W577_PSEO7|nr:DUF3224 domain-containing protein [Pseudoalteromonas piscicida]ASD69375.1 hypothetical protein B1L02_21020 [Pseudoalteromonas piscicida]AXQ99979.1 DUF3224 family protein [Pseudoalteromonas piscicida]AXR04265.1 DUF3224 family protein [Pseudoalteromonas piscicida]
MQLTGVYEIINWQETTEKQFDDGAKLSKAVVSLSYIGEIEGNSEVYYQLHYTEEGDVEFNGFEAVTGCFSGQQGKVVLMHDGRFKHGKAHSNFTVVQSDVDAIAVGDKGSFESTEGKKANYQITHN